MVAALARESDFLEQPFLEGLRPELDRAHDERVDALICPRGLLSEHVGVVRDEVAAVPVALENRGDLVNHVRVAGAGDADVPF